MHDCIEDYVDDVVVKSKKSSQYINDLRRVFIRRREYNLKMNLLKCVFGVSSGNFIEFIVHHKGIDIDPTKPKAIQDMNLHKIVKELKSFMGKVSYIRRFIPALSDLIELFHKLFVKTSIFQTFNKFIFLKVILIAKI